MLGTLSAIVRRRETVCRSLAASLSESGARPWSASSVLWIDALVLTTFRRCTARVVPEPVRGAMRELRDSPSWCRAMFALALRSVLMGLFGVGTLFRLAAFGPADGDEQRDRVRLAGVGAGCAILGIACAITNFSASIVIQGLAVAVMFWTRRAG